MSSLLERMKAAGSIKMAAMLDDSPIFSIKAPITTQIPIINVAMSGEIDGGLIPGLTVLAGPSKHFKSNLGLVMIAAYMKKYTDAVCLFYDSEYGITPEYIAANGIDTKRVIHIPLEHVEQLKFDIVKRLEEINLGDKVIIFVDSLGNLASKKEVEDALEEKSVADMSRAKAIKSLFRIITPHLTVKQIPCIVVNHTYKTQEMYSKDIVSGGTGVTYSSNTIWIIGRSQEKEGTDVVGWNFNINVEKSRFVKEKSKLSFLVTYDGGINLWSGLMDLALESGHCIKPKMGWYSKPGEDKNYRLDDTNNTEFWNSILNDQSFKDFVKNKFQLGTVAFLGDKNEDS